MQERCVRNRKRPKTKRAIHCPIHKCSVESVSQKHLVYADRPEQLQQEGMGKRSAQMLISAQGPVTLNGQWLEKFWCSECQELKWYHVRQCDRTYEISIAPREIWQRSQGVYNPGGNPSVGEFTQQNARGIRNKSNIC